MTFPATRVSLLAGIASDRASERHRALERVVQAYWKPVDKYARLKWKRSHDDAEDLTQGFFAAASEKEYLAAFDAAKGRFRSVARRRRHLSRTIVDSSDSQAFDSRRRPRTAPQHHLWGPWSCVRTHAAEVHRGDAPRDGRHSAIADRPSRSENRPRAGV